MNRKGFVKVCIGVVAATVCPVKEPAVKGSLTLNDYNDIVELMGRFKIKDVDNIIFSTDYYYYYLKTMRNEMLIDII